MEYSMKERNKEMNRWIFWIWKSLKKSRRHCRGFCPACVYYERCCRDGERLRVKVRSR